MMEMSVPKSSMRLGTFDVLWLQLMHMAFASCAVKLLVSCIQPIYACMQLSAYRHANSEDTLQICVGSQSCMS